MATTTKSLKMLMLDPHRLRAPGAPQDQTRYVLNVLNGTEYVTLQVDQWGDEGETDLIAHLALTPLQATQLANALMVAALNCERRVRSGDPDSYVVH